MAAHRRQAREFAAGDLLEAEWSDWELAMAPSPVGFEPRGSDQAGLIRSDIRKAFPDLARHCGIYEWQAKGTLRGQPNRVVYVGSTCRDKPGALRQRILEYCANGSHKSDFINDALDRGYELWVRVKIVKGKKPSKEKAEAMENLLLDAYDYAWNKRDNGKMRRILP